MKKQIWSIFFAVAGTMLFAACGTEESQEKHYIKLSDAVCTFTADGTDAFAINVRSNPGWSAESGASWVKVTDMSENTLTVSVEPNTEVERSTEILLTAGAATATIDVYQLGVDGMNARYRLLDDLNSAMISPNGRYVGGYYIGAVDNEMDYTAVIIDLETDERIEFGPYPESLLGMDAASAMTDQGILYVSDFVNGGCIAFDLTGDYFRPESLPGGYGATVISGVSEDGSILVGYSDATPNGYIYGPLKFVNGEGQELPLPEKNFRDEEWWAGVLARGISADGTVIYGTSWEDYDYGMVWWDEAGNVDWVGSDVRKVTPIKREDATGKLVDYNLVDGVICWNNQTQVSPNGEWIAGTFRTEAFNESDNSVLQSNYPAFFNTETGTTTVFDEYGGYVALHVTNDGMGVIGPQSLGVYNCVMVDLESKTVMGPMSQWIQDNYGILVETGVLLYVTPDNEKLFGYNLSNTNGGQSFTTTYWYVAPPLD
ncbi:MAG TPA: BACON domain-containing protein [Candidatus Tidjanibacter gallistercoris]|nr:BACON domain-containing protein [Candidatus Tidjanibacter gallistercoris]